MSFSPATVNVPAGKAFSLTLDNKDGAPHNVAIYKDSSAAEKISVGEIVTSATATQQVPALDKGPYFFRCDVHHEMTGRSSPSKALAVQPPGRRSAGHFSVTAT